MGIFCLIVGKKRAKHPGFRHLHMVACVVSCSRFSRLITLAHTNWYHYSSLSALATSDLLDGLVSSLANVLLRLRLIGLLGLHGLGFAVLDRCLGRCIGLVSVLTRLGLLSADFFDGHANDGLLNAGGLAGSLLLHFVNFNLLVIGSPGECPSELDRLDLLVEEATCLRGDEVVSPAVLRDKAATASRHDFVLSVGTLLRLSN